MDSYADSRVKVHHFINAGVSIARYRGITLAQGNYMLFVDSDDTMEPELLHRLTSTISHFGEPDLIRFQARLINDNPSKDHNRYNFPMETCCSGLEALRHWSIPGKKYAVYWIFAFKRQSFPNIIFPTLYYYEDVAVLPIVVANAQKVVTVPFIGYNYTYDNVSSLTHTRTPEAARSRAIAFAKACNYAVTTFTQIKGVSDSDIEFFSNDFLRRRNGYFNSLDEALKEELTYLYQCDLN